MENTVEAEGEGERDVCVCGVSAPSLAVLKDVQRAYEERLELVDRLGGAKKLQMQVEVFRSWVSDLVGQNALLARAVEELETEATGKLLAERARHAETEAEMRAELAALRRRLARKDSDLRGLVEVLRRLREFDYCTLEGIHFFEVTESDIFGTVQWRQKKLEQGDSRDNRRGFYKEAGARAPRHNYKAPGKMKKICHSVRELKSINENLQKENLAKEREIRRLNKDVHQYEQAIGNLRAEISTCSYHPQECAKKDVEVMVGPSNCSKLEGALDAVNYGMVLKDDAARYQERIRKMEANLKSSGESVRALRKVNVALSEELHALRRVCAALDDQCRAGALRAQFKDEIIREMRRQLKQAKAKVPVCQAATSTPNCSVSCAGHESPCESVNPSPISHWGETIAELERSLLEEFQSFDERCNSKTCPSQKDLQDCSTLPCPASSPPPCIPLPPCPSRPGPCCLDESEPRICPERSQCRPPSPKPCKSLRINEECPASSSGSSPRSKKCTDSGVGRTPCNRWPCGSQPCPKVPKECPSWACPRETSKSCPASSNVTPCGSPRGYPRSGSTKTSPVCGSARNSCPGSPRSCPRAAPPCPGVPCEQMSTKSSILKEFISKITSWSPKDLMNQACSTSSTSKATCATDTSSGKESCPKQKRVTCCPRPLASMPCPAPPGMPCTNTATSPCPSVPKLCLETPKPCALEPKPCSAAPKPCPAVSKPCGAMSKPCPASSNLCASSPKPCPTSPKPCPASPKPCPASQKPCPATIKPCSPVSKPCPAASKPCPVSEPCPPIPVPCFAPLPCSASSSPRGRVRFLPCSKPPKSCARDLEELFFNKGVKQSEDSVDWDSCVNEECPAVDLGPCSTTEDFGTQNTDSKMSQECGTPSSASGGVCDAARAQYYHNKLLATLEILQNKEETVRVQAESLTVAEGRIAALTARGQQLRADGDKKAAEIRALRNQLCCLGIGGRKTDFTMQTDEEVKRQKSIVNVLQNNLAVIEDLYRECFYETAKQEQMIESLRQACLDVRLMEQEKAEQVGRLQNVVNTQRWSLERCQDIAAEVDSLKLEISNFLNNSNNDSGMWEREEPLAAELAEELADIAAQLRQLAGLLAGDCTCGLKDENKRLKEDKENMETQMNEFREKLCQMEAAIMRKECENQQCQKELCEREQELESVQLELGATQQREREAVNAGECLQRQLQQMEVMLNDKAAELAETQAQVEDLERTVCSLRCDLEKADQVIKENARVRCEVSQLTQQVACWRRQLRDSEERLHVVEEDLRAAREHCRSVDQCYREKAVAAAALQRQLEEAHERGAELCAESRRVVCAVRHWVRRMRSDNGDLEDKIKEQEGIICSLRRQLQCAPCPPPPCPPPPCPPPPCSPAPPCASQTGCSKCMRRGTDDGVISRVRAALCGPAPSATPPEGAARCCAVGRRLPRKRHCGDARCGGQRSVRECSVQEPLRSDASTSPASSCSPPVQRAASPSEELFERVERLHDALAAGQRRWSRGQLHR